MPVIKIDNFGGEMPSMSPRALPDAAAQENRNLFAGTTEFRPLKGDTSAGVSVAAAKSLFRIDSTQPWITSTQARSYVRGQINGDVSKRTYYSMDDGSAPPRAMDTTGEDRQLGVPPPVKPTASVTVADEWTWEEAGAWLRTTGGPLIRRTIAAHSTPTLAGAFSNYGLLYPDNPAVPASLQSKVWCLFAQVTEPTAGSADNPYGTWGWPLISELGAVRGTDNKLYVPLPCMPFWHQQNNTTLTPALNALMGPDGTTALLTSTMVTTLINGLTWELDPARHVASERKEMDALTQEFARILGDPDVPLGVALPVPPIAPVKPTSLPYTYETESAPSVMVPEWEDYNADLTQYEKDMAAYRREVSLLDAKRAAARDRLREISMRCASLAVQIEAIWRAQWNAVSGESSMIEELIQGLGGVAAMVPYGVDRVIDTRFYLATFVTDWGEESAPSPVSDLLEVDQNDSVNVARPAVSTGASHAARDITHWRLYRSNVGTSSAAFQFVAEIPVATTSYTDTVKAAELGEQIPTTTWLEPPANLRGLVGMPNGIMAGFFGNTVAFCEPYVPYAWPVEYQVTTEFPIVGMAAFGQTLFVGTTGNPYFISGSDSASMSAQKMESNQACASARSIAAVQGGVLYASPDGLCVADASGVKVVSQGLYTREDWQALTPSSMFAVEHEGVYYLFYNNGAKGCLAFDMASKKLGRVDLQADAAYSEIASDTLYVTSGTSVLATFSASTRRTGKWKSKKMTMPAQSGMAWLKVYGDQSADAPVTLKWYGDGVLRHTATVTSTAPQRLPTGRWLEHEIEIESTARVTRVVMAGDTQELQSL